MIKKIISIITGKKRKSTDDFNWDDILEKDKIDLQLPVRTIIVDDDPLFKEALISDIQKRNDLLIVKVNDNLDNLKKDIIELNPNLILLDVIIKKDNHEESGIDAVRELKPIYDDICFINMSTINFFRSQAYNAGADMFFMKDYEFINTYEKIMAALKEKYNFV